MSSTITWTITALDCIPQTAEGQNFVVTAHWTCAGVQDTYSASVYSTCSFEVQQGSGFTPYNQLTQDQVLGWCWANGVDKTATEAAVQQQIDNQINPPVTQPPLPWASN